MLFTNNKNTLIKERANSALVTVKHNAYTMNILRSRVESRINFIISNKGKTGHYQEMAWILELVEKGEPILNVISDRIESVQYLDEFITITNNAALSIIEVRDDVEQTLEAAEDSLSALDDAISTVVTRFLQYVSQEIQPALLAEVCIILATCKTNMANITTNEAALQVRQKRRRKKKTERGSRRSRPRA